MELSPRANAEETKSSTGSADDQIEQPLANRRANRNFLLPPDSSAKDKGLFAWFRRVFLMVKRVLRRIGLSMFDSEILHIIRPFVYVFLVMKNGRQSWLPF
eukprot:GHVR01188431.1.p1 GENE.GHVR01188431.1~~GHVR01188431.1.p1  ORF type:complete len:101 (+),score=4.88 GHVR01188431.1:59-361(+)